MTSVELTSVSLYDISDTKTKISSLRDHIHQLEEEAGIPPLREQLADLESTYKRQISEAVSQNLLVQDHLQLINKGRVMTTVSPKLLYERFPDIFWKVCKVTKGSAEDRLQWLFEDEGESKSAAKKMTKEIISEISSKSQSGTSYELIDLLNGD